jgi:DHA1 family bicyclomycin/chloramphenicol resistance-like MFS transporter
LFLFLASLGFIGPNMAALALEEHGSRAGVASAILGSAQFATSAAAASLVGLLNDGSMFSMAVVMGACAAATGVMSFVVLGREKAAEDAGPLQAR